MLILSSTSDKIQVAASAAGSVDVHQSYVDWNGTAAIPDRKNVAITTAATIDVVLSPTSGVQRNVKIITIRNKHATLANTITIIHTDGTVAVEIFKAVLAAGESIIFDENVGFTVYDVNGAAKGTGSGSGNRFSSILLLDNSTGQYMVITGDTVGGVPMTLVNPVEVA